MCTVFILILRHSLDRIACRLQIIMMCRIAMSAGTLECFGSVHAPTSVWYLQYPVGIAATAPCKQISLSSC